MELGEMVSFEKDGVIRTERVESVHCTSGSAAIYRQLNGWQRLVRRLTPPRWRRSLLIRPAEPPSATVTINNPNVAGRTLAQIEEMQSALGRILD